MKKKGRTDEGFGPMNPSYTEGKEIAGPNPKNTVDLTGRREAVGGSVASMLKLSSSEKAVMKAGPAGDVAGLKYNEGSKKKRRGD